MSAVLDTARGVLGKLNSLTSPGSSPYGVDFDPQTMDELDELSRVCQRELSRKESLPSFFPLLLLAGRELTP